MDDKKFYVYVHRRASDGSPFYYGKGSGNRRFESDRNDWHAKVVAKHGFISIMLKDGLTEKEAYAEETRLIALARARKENIVNIGDGGEGFTSESAAKAGKKGGKTNALNKTGVCGRSPEKMSEDGRKAGLIGGAKNLEFKTGVCGLTKEQRQYNGKILFKNKIGIHSPKMIGVGAKALMKQQKGIFAYTKEQLSANGKTGGKIGGKISASKKVKCNVCGLEAHAGPVAMHQKGTGHIGITKL